MDTVFTDIKYKCRFLEKRISESEREVEIEIPDDFMRQALAEECKGKDSPWKDLKSLIANPKETLYKQTDMISIVASKCFALFLGDHPEKFVGKSTLRIVDFSSNSLKLIGKFTIVPKPPIKVTEVLKVTKEKFCEAHVDKNMEREIQKHRESLAICTPIKESRDLQVNDLVVMDIEIIHHKEDVVENLTGLTFDLIEEDTAKNSQKNQKKLKLKATYETLDKVTVSTLRDPHLLSQIEESEDLFHIKAGETKKVEFLSGIDQKGNLLKSEKEDVKIINKKDLLEAMPSFKDRLKNLLVITFNVHAKKMYHKKLPPTDQEFAKSMGFSSLQQMYRKLRKKHTDLENERIEMLLHNDIIKELIKQSPSPSRGFFSKYLLKPSMKFLTKGFKEHVMESGFASKKLTEKKIKDWMKSGYIQEQTESLILEIKTLVKFTQKYDIFNTIVHEFTNKISATPGLYQKMRDEMGPDQDIRRHPMIYDLIKRTVAKTLLSSAIITEIEPTDRDERKEEFSPEALKATHSKVLTES